MKHTTKNNSKNVLLVTAMHGFGGTERSTQRLTDVLKTTDYTPILASDYGPLAQVIHQAGTRHIALNTHPKSLFAMIKTLFGFINIFRQEPIALVHAQMAFPIPFIWLAKMLAGKPNLPILWHSRGLMANTYPKVAKLFKLLGINAVGNCHFESKKLIRHGMPESKVNYIYNLMPALPSVQKGKFRQQMNIAPDSLLIGTITRLSKARGPDHFVRLANTIASDYPQSVFVVAGDGEDKAALKHLGKPLVDQGRLRFLGAVDDIHAFYADVDLVVNTPLFPGDTSAGTGNIPIEAALHKVPIVNYGEEPAGELVITGKTGFLVPTGDEAELEKATRMALDALPEANQMAESANQLVDSLCGYKDFYARLVAIYAQCIEQKPMNTLTHTYQPVLEGEV